MEGAKSLATALAMLVDDQDDTEMVASLRESICALNRGFFDGKHRLATIYG
jgi:hypothetical protein